MQGIAIPRTWTRRGLVLGRPGDAAYGSVAGDPCIAWDEEAGTWRMWLFYAPPGHAQAVAVDPVAGGWRLEGPLVFTNPEDLVGGTTHKPFVVMDAHHPNRAAHVSGRYWLVTVSGRGAKCVQRAWATRLAGPWTLEAGPLIAPGTEHDFDARHADAVTGYHFADRGTFLYFYMGYPLRAQPHAVSPYGSAQGAAVQGEDEPQARKLGVILPPSARPGHWAAGWVGGLQLLPGRAHRWVGLCNASPTAPNPNDPAISREEPPPSLGGFAWCDAPWPVQGWQWSPEPIEHIQDVPPEAIAAGEGVNLWRQHILIAPDGRLHLYYNSGPYGREQLYGKVSD